MRPPITGIVRKYKRANFTRSKTGCLTCRGKKIKCDETKPECMRCVHHQRKCIWGEGAPSIRKKRTSQQEPPFPVDSDSIEESRTSRAEAATPLTRSPSPPKQEPDEMGIPPMVSRRHSDSNREMPVNANAVRRPVQPHYVQGYSSTLHRHLHPQHYPYSQPYSGSMSHTIVHRDHAHIHGTDSASALSQWSSHQLSAPSMPSNSMESYPPAHWERNQAGSSSRTTHRPRYYQ